MHASLHSQAERLFLIFEPVASRLQGKQSYCCDNAHRLFLSFEAYNYQHCKNPPETIRGSF